MPRMVIVGVSHHLTPLEVRECLAFDAQRWYARSPRGLPSVLVSTCNRVEVYAWVTGRSAPAVRALQRSLADAAGLDLAELQPYLAVFTGHEALLHLVRVAAGLDSLVVGEDQISGQLRDALRLAESVAALPTPLRGVFQRATESARRIRGGTRLEHRPSVASAGVHVAQRSIADGLADKPVVVLGAGVMARAAAESLIAKGARVRLLNRTPGHAEALAGYQMDPGNGREALREVALDLAEGADMVIVKPALAYLDVVHAVKSAYPDVPLAAYHVSGEYSMLKAAVLRGWLDEKRAVLEALTSIARAGADLTITYYAKDAARWTHET